MSPTEDSTAGNAKPPPSTDVARYLMPFKAVRIDVLDEHGDPVIKPSTTGQLGGPIVASGFLMLDQASLYLYTCWHVVTGINLDSPVLPGAVTSLRRMKLRISMQANEVRNRVAVAVGGMHKFDIDLYDTSVTPPLPLWEQDEQSTPNTSLSAASLAQPFWHDVVRIRLPDEVRAVDWQVVTQSDIWPSHVAPGDPLLLVGYPYGYSVVDASPTPIVLRRCVAANRGGPPREVLIDGAGAPGMSGGPVFCESGGKLFLFGLYIGVIYPDSPSDGRQPDRAIAIGRVCPLNLLHHRKLVRTPLQGNET